MYSRNRRIGATVLALVISLSISPLLIAGPQRDRSRDRSFREKDPDPIVRVINKVRTIVKRLTGQDDYPVPPIP